MVFGQEVDDGGDDGLEDSELGAQTEREEHDEEQNRPERSDGQSSNGSRISDESQSRSLINQIQSIKSLT